MITHFIEATDETEFNHGKFMLGRFDEDVISALPGYPLPLLRSRWGGDHLFIMDLETGEGAMFHMMQNVQDIKDQLNDRHRIWVCPMFEPFLYWLVMQDLTDITKLPRFVKLEDASKFCALRRQRTEGKKIKQ